MECTKLLLHALTRLMHSKLTWSMHSKNNGYEPLRLDIFKSFGYNGYSWLEQEYT